MRKLLALVCFFMILIISGCSQNKKQDAEINTKDTETSTKENKIEISEEYVLSGEGHVCNYFNTLNQLVEETDYYAIYSDSSYTGYQYEIYDEDKMPFWYGYVGWRSANFEQDGDILKMRISSGGNIGIEVFFNVKERKVSRYFEMALDNSDELVAYFGGPAPSGGVYIIIQNMFDPNDFYLEFVRNVSDSSLINSYTLDAQFIENNTKFKLTYQTAKDYKEVTEIFDLR